MKSDDLTPKALLQFFSELESGGADEECEIHYGCSCVIGKGLKAAQMLVEVQKALGVDGGASAPVEDDDEATSAKIMEVEAALMSPGISPPPAAVVDPSAERLEEAEGEIDRLLVQTVELKEENKKLREKMRELYKQIERLYTRNEMTKLLGSLDETEAREAAKEKQAESSPGEDAEAAEASKRDAEANEEALAEGEAEASGEASEELPDESPSDGDDEAPPESAGADEAAADEKSADQESADAGEAEVSADEGTPDSEKS